MGLSENGGPSKTGPLKNTLVSKIMSTSHETKLWLDLGRFKLESNSPKLVISTEMVPKLVN